MTAIAVGVSVWCVFAVLTRRVAVVVSRRLYRPLHVSGPVERDHAVREVGWGWGTTPAHGTQVVA